MRKRTRIPVGGLIAALALAALVGTATARRLEVSGQQFLVLFRETSYQSEVVTAVCDINLEGSFHSRTMSKVSGALIGQITEAIAHHPCTSNEWVMLNGAERLPGGETTANTLPWHVRYLSFVGSLPGITGIEVAIVNYAFQVTWGGISCLYQATAERPMRGIASVETRSSRITGFRFNETIEIPKHSGGILCGPEIGFLGNGPVGTQREWRELFVRLVA